MTGTCEICNQWKHLDRHHVFNSYNRNNSEKYGAVINICRDCHQKVHANAEIRNNLKAEWEERLIDKNGWSIEEFIEIFGKNYL